MSLYLEILTALCQEALVQIRNDFGVIDGKVVLLLRVVLQVEELPYASIHRLLATILYDLPIPIAQGPTISSLVPDPVEISFLGRFVGKHNTR